MLFEVEESYCLAPMENSSSNGSLFMSAVGIGVGLGVGLGLVSTQLMASSPRGDVTLGGGATAADIESELRRLLVDGQETKISFSDFPYYLRCMCGFLHPFYLPCFDWKNK